ncbi:MAG: hypothetical protein AB7O73_13380 [Bacteroidia bacterium]
MGLFNKIVGAAGYGGNQMCKYCKEKKTVMSTYACSKGINSGQPHKWIDADKIEDEPKESSKEEKKSGGGVGKWLLKQATKKYKG